MSNLTTFSPEHRHQGEQWLARVNTNLEVLGEGQPCSERLGSPLSTGEGDDEDGRPRRSARTFQRCRTL